MAPKVAGNKMVQAGDNWYRIDIDNAIYLMNA